MLKFKTGQNNTMLTRIENADEKIRTLNNTETTLK